MMTAEIWASTATFKRGTMEKISFLLLHHLDLLLTVLAVSRGLYEMNPLMRYLVTVPVLLLAVKSALPWLIAWLVPGRLLLPASILLGIIVVWNIRELCFSPVF